MKNEYHTLAIFPVGGYHKHEMGLHSDRKCVSHGDLLLRSVTVGERPPVEVRERVAINSELHFHFSQIQQC